MFLSFAASPKTTILNAFGGKIHWRHLLLVCLLGWVSAAYTQDQVQAYVPLSERGLEIQLWAKEPMLRNPVALSFDDQGAVYVVETARRGSVDIDIRSHKEWVLRDLASDTYASQVAAFKDWMSPQNSEDNRSWLKDYNGDGSHDWHDLTMVKEKVHRLEDTDNDGVADISQVFAEGFSELNHGAAAGVLPHEGAVYFTIYPDVWRLIDKDKDGVADQKEIMHRGFGVHAAYDGHDIHGLTVGPDGYIYFSVGDNGISLTTREGRRLYHPNTGGVLRMRPDGSDLQVFALGLRNVQELAFDEWGNLFSVDNDGDIRGERERFVYIAEGSDSGWRLNWQFKTKGWAPYTGAPDYNPWIEEKMWIPHHLEQPAHITPPLSNYSVGPGGFAFNPGTALNDQYKQTFFLAQFPVKKITAFKVRPLGAFFEMYDEHIFHQGLMASAMKFGPDGAAYIADWDGMWMPNQKGSIYRVDDPTQSHSALRQEVRGLLKRDFSDAPSSLIASWIAHPDQRVRLKAQFEWVRRGDLTNLIRTVLDARQPVLGRVHALWGLSQLGKGLSQEQIKALPLDDDHPELRAQSAKLLGDLHVSMRLPELIGALQDPSDRVKYHAALAIGKLKDAGKEALNPVLSMLASNADRDPFLRHAGVMAMSGMASIESLLACVDHPSMPVRRAVVVALRRLGAPGVSLYLNDEHPWVVREAARAIHDDFSISAALPDLARLLEHPSPSWINDEAVVRRSISANRRLGQSEDAKRLLGFGFGDSGNEAIRMEALMSLATWDDEPFLDRVVGRIRHPQGRFAGRGSSLLKEAFTPELQKASGSWRESLMSLILEYDIPVDERIMMDWVGDGDLLPEMRQHALSVLLRNLTPTSLDVIRQFLERRDEPLYFTALCGLAQADPAFFAHELAEVFDQLPRHQQQEGIGLIGRLPASSSLPFLKYQFQKFKEGKLNRELHLDLLEALHSLEPSILPDGIRRDPFLQRDRNNEQYRHALLWGGNPDRGKEVYQSHPLAQCVRCHEAGGQGLQVGPVLSGLGQRVDRSYLLESLIEPSATVVDGYQGVELSLVDGDELSGRLLEDTADSLQLQLLDGSKRDVPKSSIDSFLISSVSSMPPMGDILSTFELRDLIVYLHQNH